MILTPKLNDNQNNKWVKVTSKEGSWPCINHYLTKLLLLNVHYGNNVSGKQIV